MDWCSGRLRIHMGGRVRDVDCREVLEVRVCMACSRILWWSIKVGIGGTWSSGLVPFAVTTTSGLRLGWAQRREGGSWGRWVQ